MTAPDQIQQQKIDRNAPFSLSSELAQLQWGLATQTGRGKLDAHTNYQLQACIVDAFQETFQEMSSGLSRILYRLRDDEVGTKVRHDEVSADWPHDEFLFDDGAVAAFRYATTWQPKTVPSYDTADEEDR
jgi:hypothetical protein